LSWHAISGNRSSVRTFQILMILFVVAGVVGSVFHVKANIESELHLEPTLKVVELSRRAVTGKVPALAPGVMIQIGLVGLAFTWRHPALTD